MNAWKKILAGSATLGMLLAGASMIAPERAAAAKCYITKIPYGYQPAGVPCGQAPCAGERYTNPQTGHSICVLNGDQY